MTIRRALAFVGVTASALAIAAVSSGDVATLPRDGGAAQTGLTAERIRQALVSVEVAGRATAIGIVLESDGRMLTALSSVGTSDTADVRYADGHTIHVRVGHRDALWDLALLVPLSGRFTTGLLASELDPLTSELRSGSLATGRPSMGPAKLKGRADVHAKDGTNLPFAMELERAPALGSPLLDQEGHVLGLAVHECRNADGAACSETTVIVPIGMIRGFLSRTPSNAVPPSPWLGINGAPDVINGIRGVRIQAVAPHSPAERGGLKGASDPAHADLIVVADGQPLDTPERLAELVSKHAVGETLKLSVFAAGRYREVLITLQASP